MKFAGVNHCHEWIRWSQIWAKLEQEQGSRVGQKTGIDANPCQIDTDAFRITSSLLRLWIR